MRRVKNKRARVALMLVLAASSPSGCGLIGEPEDVVETWTGPGEADGQILPTEPEEDALHPLGQRDSIEHWYFDARLDNGYVAVGFLWASEMRNHKPAMELHIYRPGGDKLSVTKTFSTSDLHASQEKCDVQIGENRAYAEYPADRTLPIYHLFLSEGELGVDLIFQSEIQGWKPGGGKTQYGKEGFFAWVVPVPRARVEGTLRIQDEILPVRGIGYHDHNWATADLKKVISYWYWGRIYTDDFTLLYAYVKTTGRFGGVASKPLMLAYKDRVIASTGEMTVNTGPAVFFERANRSYPVRVEIEVPDTVYVSLDVQEILDAQDFLEGVNPVFKRFINVFFGRPGWFRFRSNYSLIVQMGGSRYERKGETLHEMVALR